MDPSYYEVIDIYENGDEYLDALIPAIQSAKKSIFIESYIFELPHPGKQLLQLLEKKQHEGLDIKILVDGVGSLGNIPALLTWSETTWVPVRVFNPLPWVKLWRILFFPFFILKLIWDSQSLNRRDHRKIIVIDDEIAFLGSINFSKSHFKLYSPEPWFDLAVQIRGHSISILSRAFLNEFNKTKPSPRERWNELLINFKNRFEWFPMDQKIRLNNHLLLRFLYWKDLLRRIRHAKARIYIMNAYFVPHRTLLNSLIFAAKKGVEVILLLPSKSDVLLIKWFAPIFYKRLLKSGVQIREMQSPMLHTKSILIDDWALIGSNNLNYRSLIHDLEAEAVVDSPEMIQKLLRIWNQKIDQSIELYHQDVEKISWWSWIRYRIVLLFRYFV